MQNYLQSVQFGNEDKTSYFFRKGIELNNSIHYIIKIHKTHLKCYYCGTLENSKRKL